MEIMEILLWRYYLWILRSLYFVLIEAGLHDGTFCNLISPPQTCWIFIFKLEQVADIDQ